MDIIITREKGRAADCTLGLVVVPGLTLCTLELPWIPAGPGDKGGVKGKSCVPLGTYKLERHVSRKKYPSHTFALVNHDLDVVHYEGDDNDPDEDRATCLLHAANYAGELRGCVALGLSHMKTGDTYMVTSSRKAMDKFFSVVPWADGHTLTIQESL
jgi:hypothetical protein